MFAFRTVISNTEVEVKSKVEKLRVRKDGVFVIYANSTNTQFCKEAYRSS